MDKMIGREFGRLKVLSKTTPPKGKEYTSNIGKWYKCECKCGNIVPVAKMSLLNHSVTSCGCYRSERAREVLKQNRELMIENGNTTAPKTTQRILELDGESKSLSAWAREIGISKEALRQRLKKHSVKEALSMKRGDIDEH